MEEPPFEPRFQLCCTLELADDDLSIRRRPRTSKEVLPDEGDAPDKDYLPGQPRVALQDPGIDSYLEQEFLTRDLDRLAPYLWLVGTQNSSHISSLTEQVFRGRNIIVTEDPGLHLLWIYDRIYIKPIPRYFMSHAFWKHYLIGEHSPIENPLRIEIAKAALGFLRTYVYLIRHKSDFFLATGEKLRLLPKNVSYTDFIKFITNIERIQDDDVSPRYAFGELRLGRLNMWSKVFLRRFAYRRVHQEYGAYFTRFYGQLLFVFAVFSLSLSALQVALAIQRPNAFGQSWETFARISEGVAPLTLVGVALIVIVLVSLFVFMGLRETIFAVKALYRKMPSRTQRDVEQVVSKK